MKIRMKTLASGPKGRLLPDHVYDSKEIGKKFAKELVEGGYAEKVLPEPPAAAGGPAEKRTMQPGEQADMDPKEDTTEGAEAQADDGGGDPVIDATPGAVKYANKHGVDLSQVEGSGQNGRIQQPDVVAFRKAQAAKE